MLYVHPAIQQKTASIVSFAMLNVLLAQLTVVIALDVRLVNLHKKVNVSINVLLTISKMITFVNFALVFYVKLAQANMMGLIFFVI